MPTACSIMRWIAQHQSCAIARREVFCAAFSRLRRNMHTIIFSLREGDAYAVEISDGLCSRLYEWLTVPVPFDGRIAAALSGLGSPDQVANQWGEEARIAYVGAGQAASELEKGKNPVICELRRTIADARKNGQRLKILCHQAARPHFEAAMSDGEQFSSEDFIHTHANYRETEPFDTLIKVGPFRSRGWAAAPDALLTSPRFATLVQIVWSGGADEPDFGLDPATGCSVMREPITPYGISWRRTATRIGDGREGDGDPVLTEKDENEFLLFAPRVSRTERTAAVLVQVDEDHGILFPPRARVLAFDKDASEDEQLGQCVPVELRKDMHVVLPLQCDADLGSLQAKEGTLSRVWKERLVEEVKRDRAVLSRRLSEEGVRLVCLESRIQDWAKPPAKVIPGPQEVDHFRGLLRALDIELDAPVAWRNRTVPWWQRAWAEVRRSRGEAIQEGQCAQAIVGEQMTAALNGQRSFLLEKCRKEDDFEITLPAGSAVDGSFRFCRVYSVEDGFCAPRSAMTRVLPVKEVEQWRA